MTDSINIAVVHNPDETKQTLLERVLEQSRFWDCLSRQAALSEKAPADFRIAIQPNLECFSCRDSRATDPELVEHLLDLLNGRGYAKAGLCGTRDEWDLWLENRDVEVVADLAGYRFATPGGRPYGIADLALDLDPARLPQDSILAKPGISRTWLDADFRINFAKNKTHETQGYALCLHNLAGILPLRDKLCHYHQRLDFAEVCLEALRQAPPHFNIIDAHASNHGPHGTRSETPLPTATMIAGSNLLLTDFAGALKMGVDPYVSPANAVALRQEGLPKRYEILGDLEPYPGWRNVHVITQRSVAERDCSGKLGRVVAPWVQSLDRELFPFKSIVDEQLQARLVPFLEASSTGAIGQALYAALNFGLGFLQRQWDTWEILARKSHISRRERDLGFDVRDYAPSDYKAVIEYLAPMRMLLQRTAKERSGFRWQYLDGSVICEGSRHFPAPYDDFVERVDISSTIRNMNDYIGGTFRPIKKDSKGRVVHQAERNIYLPQPNWLALFGGRFIDVGKLEVIHYRKHRQSIYWRTVASLNGSAEFDDGIVDFTREKDGGVRVSIFTRQKFTLPMFFQILDIDLVPEIKNQLVERAYSDFLESTYKNLMALYNGGDASIGSNPDPLHHEAEDIDHWREQYVAKVTRAAADIIRSIVGSSEASRAAKARSSRAAPANAVETDADGFQHFEPEFPEEQPADTFGLEGIFAPARAAVEATNMDWADVANGLFKAIRKDVGMWKEQRPI